MFHLSFENFEQNFYYLQEKLFCSYLQKTDNFTPNGSQKPRLHGIVKKGGWETYGDHQEIGHRQVNEVHVGQRPKVPIPPHCQTDQQITHNPQQKNGHEQCNQNPVFHARCDEFQNFSVPLIIRSYRLIFVTAIVRHHPARDCVRMVFPMRRVREKNDVAKFNELANCSFSL